MAASMVFGVKPIACRMKVDPWRVPGRSLTLKSVMHLPDLVGLPGCFGESPAEITCKGTCCAVSRLQPCRSRRSRRTVFARASVSCQLRGHEPYFICWAEPAIDMRRRIAVACFFLLILGGAIGLVLADVYLDPCSSMALLI